MRSKRGVWYFVAGVGTCAVFLVVIAGCKGAKRAKTEENKALIRVSWEKVMNRGNLKEAEKVFSPDYVYHPPGSPDLRGLEEGVRKPVSLMREGFPDIHFTVLDMIAEGDLVVHRWEATGTHLGEFMGIPPTGKKVVMTGIVLSRIEEGKIIEDWAHSDRLGLLQQLGLIPPMGRTDFSWGGSEGARTSAPGDVEKNKAVYRREATELWVQGNLDIADELFSRDFVNHDPVWPKVIDRESFKEWAAEWLASSTDRKLTIENLVAEGDKVAALWTYSAKDTSGKEIVFTGIDICRFSGGKIVERWWSKDVLGAMQ